MCASAWHLLYHSNEGSSGVVASVVSNSYDPMDCSLPGSSVPGVSQARLLAWVAVCFSMGSSQPRDRTHISYIAGGFFTTELPKFPIVMKGYYYLTVFILLDLWYINFEPSLQSPGNFFHCSSKSPDFILADLRALVCTLHPAEWILMELGYKITHDQ